MNPNINRRILDAMECIADGRNDLAIGILWQVRRDLEAKPPLPGNEAFQKLVNEEFIKKLPAMQPVKKAKKRVRAVDVECPTCGAQPGQQCHRMTKRGVGGEVIADQYVAHNHNPRITRARNL